MEIGLSAVSLKRSLSKTYIQIILLCGIVFVIYYPTLKAEISLLDDYGMITSLSNNNEQSLKNLFVPHLHQGGYYRPLIGLSYFFDKIAWDLSPVIMHFENIALHLLVVLLVLWFGNLLYAGKPRGGMVAFVVALLFALHPLDTESVNWISGRTDILAATILFAGFCLLLHAKVYSNRFVKWLVKCLAVFLIVISGLAKETTFAFLMAMPILYSGLRNGYLLPVFNNVKSGIYWYFFWCFCTIFIALFTYNYWLVLFVLCLGWCAFYKYTAPEKTYFLDVIKAAAFCGLGILLFWGFRKLAFVSNVSKISQTIKLMFEDLNYTIHLFIGGIGFYFKKFIFPLPLNIAIREIDPAYSLLGIIIILVVSVLIFHKSLFSSLVLTGIAFLLPVLPLTLGTVAWTAYADRYVYLAIPFWLLAFGCFAIENTKPADSYRLNALIFSLLIAFAVITFQRNLIWRTNLSLFADTVEKSPRIRVVRSIYMTALTQANRYDDAINQYKIAKTLPFIGYDEQLDLLYADILGMQGKQDEAGKMYEYVFEKTRGTSVGALRGLIGYYEYMITKNKCYGDDCTQHMKDYAERLVKLTSSTNDYYLLGKIYIKCGDITAAKNAFNVVLSSRSVDDGIKASIAKILLRNRRE